MNGYLSHCHCLSIMNNVAVNINVQILGRHVFISLGCLPKSRIARYVVTLCLAF